MTYVLENYNAAHNEESLLMLITEVSRTTAIQVLNELNLTQKFISITKANKIYGRRNVADWINRGVIEFFYPDEGDGKRLRVKDLEALAGVTRIVGYQNFIVYNFMNIYHEYSIQAKWKSTNESMTEIFRQFLDWKMNWYEAEKREEFITRVAKDKNYIRYKNMFLRYKKHIDD
ncbi:hypothetical protein ACS126_09895 [Sphingobacterium lactis]|uniref:hypothetical protein n=1 Tax=Sphingobacterium lactis TaxID=797291 RepID=UPI003EC63EEB